MATRRDARSDVPAAFIGRVATHTYHIQSPTRRSHSPHWDRAYVPFDPHLICPTPTVLNTQLVGLTRNTFRAAHPPIDCFFRGFITSRTIPNTSYTPRYIFIPPTVLNSRLVGLIDISPTPPPTKHPFPCSQCAQRIVITSLHLRSVQSYTTRHYWKIPSIKKYRRSGHRRTQLDHTFRYVFRYVDMPQRVDMPRSHHECPHQRIENPSHTPLGSNGVCRGA